MERFYWIILVLIVILVSAFGYFYYQGSTYVSPKIDSTTTKSIGSDSSDSSKSITELVPTENSVSTKISGTTVINTESTSNKSVSSKISDKANEFKNASTADKAKMLLTGAALLTPVGLAAYGGSKLLKKMRNKK